MRKYVLPEHISADSFPDLLEFTQSAAIVQFLVRRGITSVEELQRFQKGAESINHKDIWEIEKVGELILKYVSEGKKICVYGDYDVDGMVAASILWRYLSKELGAKSTIYIPNRQEEGYGLNNEALEDIASQGYDVVITVDCGVRDADLIAQWQSKKLEIIVTDHHQPGEKIPECPIVHPLYPDKEAANKYTSGTVVAWKLIRTIEELRKTEHTFSDSVVDLVGLSLVTDIMPLLEENRAIIIKALEKARTDPSLPIKLILLSQQIQPEQCDIYHFGFIIGPRLNSTGRVGNAYQTVRLLATDKEEFALSLLREIETTNIQRQSIMKRVFEEADQAKTLVRESLIVAYGEGWEDGVIGLVAGRLLQRYDMPTIVMTKEKNSGLLKGSARSITNLNITEVLEGIKENLAKYGGHHAAAGFTVKDESFENFIAALEKHLAEQYTNYVPENTRTIDISISPRDVSEDLMKGIELLEPYGQGNFAPLVAIKGQIHQINMMGAMGEHARIHLSSGDAVVTCVFFNAKAVVGKFLQGDTVTFVGKVKRNTFRGNTEIQFYIDDVIDYSPSEKDGF